MTARGITVTEREKAELLPLAPPPALGAKEVRGSTIVTLVSPGTELSWNYLGDRFPNRPGYAAVFRAEEAGQEATGVEPGELLFCMGQHQSFQQTDVSSVVAVPRGLPPHEAVIARLMGVSMTTLVTTAARPGDIVLVTGAGPVGYLAAHLFANAGYDVRVVEPDAARRRMVQRSGITMAYPSVPLDDPALKGMVGLVLECSGHEQPVLEGCRLVRKGAEVVLIGVPWSKRTELSAHELLWAVFHNYVVLRSGWEWELPRHASDFRPHSIFTGLRLALSWLAQGRIPLDGLIVRHDPGTAQSVYQRLLRGEMDGLFQVFDWQRA